MARPVKVINVWRKVAFQPRARHKVGSIVKGSFPIIVAANLPVVDVPRLGGHVSAIFVKEAIRARRSPAAHRQAVNTVERLVTIVEENWIAALTVQKISFARIGCVSGMTSVFAKLAKRRVAEPTARPSAMVAAGRQIAHPRIVQPMLRVKMASAFRPVWGKSAPPVKT
jgi:hypothetical protein